MTANSIDTRAIVLANFYWALAIAYIPAGALSESKRWPSSASNSYYTYIYLVNHHQDCKG